MKPQTVKIIYWILLSLLCLFMLADGYGGITKQQAGIDALKHLGYPDYIMPLFGGLKILGVIALLQQTYAGIKEWVFAGLTFIFIGASVSHICSGDPLLHTIMPLVFLAFMFLVRHFELKKQALSNNA
jgi:hypothetical protein